MYANHPNLERVGMAAGGVQGFEAFAGSKVNSFMVCGRLIAGGIETCTSSNTDAGTDHKLHGGDTELKQLIARTHSEDEEMKWLAEKMRQYVQIYSYGREGT